MSGSTSPPKKKKTSMNPDSATEEQSKNKNHYMNIIKDGKPLTENG